MRYLLVLLLAGCASTPTEVMEQGPRTDFTSARAPRDAAECIERSASEIKWGIVGVSKDARMRPAREAGSFEVLYTEFGITIAVALIRPTASGTAISIWRNPLVEEGFQGEGTLEDQMTLNCVAQRLTPRPPPSFGPGVQPGAR